MGMKDFEIERDTKIKRYGIGSNEEIEKSLLDHTAANTSFTLQFADYLTSTDPIKNILNRPVFRYTKLREEIFFVNCRVYDKGTDKFCNYQFAVNETTLYKRFTFYKDSTFAETYSKSDYDPVSILKKALVDSDMKIRLNIYNFETKVIEQDKIDAVSSEVRYKIIKDLYIADGNPVEIIGFENRSKYTWWYYFDKIPKVNSPILGDIRTAGSDAFYDITSDNMKKFNVLLM